MILHQNGPLTFALVQVPSKSAFHSLEKPFGNHHQQFRYISAPGINGKFVVDEMPDGNWQLVGKADMLNEEQMREIVEESKRGVRGFLCYTDNCFAFSNAKPSFASLLATHNLSTVNTYVLKMIEK